LSPQSAANDAITTIATICLLHDVVLHSRTIGDDTLRAIDYQMSRRYCAEEVAYRP
jgi:hypothetical protein